MATTFDLRIGGTLRLPAAGANQLVKLDKIIDFDENNVESGDTVQIFNLPAGATVQQVVAEVQTAEGATCTADVGDDDDADGFLDGVNLNSVAKSACAPGVLTEGTPNTIVPAYGSGRFCATAKVLSMLMNNDASAGKVKISAFCYLP